MNHARIFIIDDERTIRLTFRLALETDGYDVQEAASADEAMMGFGPRDVRPRRARPAHRRRQRPGRARRDAPARHPDADADDHRLRQHPQAVRAMQLGAIDFLEKPIEPVGAAQDRRGHRGASPAARRERGRPAASRIACARRSGSSTCNDFEAAGEMIDEALRLDDTLTRSAQPARRPARDRRRLRWRAESLRAGHPSRFAPRGGAAKHAAPVRVVQLRRQPGTHPFRRRRLMPPIA